MNIKNKNNQAKSELMARFCRKSLYCTRTLHCHFSHTLDYQRVRSTMGKISRPCNFLSLHNELGKLKCSNLLRGVKNLFIDTNAIRFVSKEVLSLFIEKPSS